MSDMNPYQQPQSDVANAAPASANEFTIIAPRKISVGDAMGWIGKGHGMLSGHWGVVLGALVVTVLITSALQIIPLLGAIAQILLTPLLYAGIVKIFHRIDTENRSDFSDLFAGFSDRTNPLIMTAVAQFVVLLVAGVVLGGLFFLLGRDGTGWEMTGCDTEGCDLRLGGEIARLDYDAPVRDADETRKALVGLAKHARQSAAE